MSLPNITLKYDAPVKIATGASRKSIKWKNTEMPWSKFVSRLSVPLRTSETAAEYKALPKAKRDEIKDVGGFVGGAISGERRRAERIKSRSLITLDLDAIPKSADLEEGLDAIFDNAFALYSTHSSTPDSKRLRFVAPLARDVSPEEYEAIAAMIAADIGLSYCDPTTFEPARLMYWASCPVDAEYIFRYNDGPFLDPDDVLDRYDDWTDRTEWPTAARADKAAAANAKKQKDPREKKGIVGAFCKAYTVPEAIAEFLPGVYKEAGPGRYTYNAGSTVAGVVLYEDGNFVFSHHGTDPAGGRLLNAFDLVRIHKFGNLDIDSPEDVSGGKRPSFKAMAEFAAADEKAGYALALEKVSDAFKEDEEETEWLKELEITSSGFIAGTINNAVIILKNDSRLKDSYYYDAFKERPIVSGDLPWIKHGRRQSDVWADSDDAGLRNFLEREYRIGSAAKIRDAVEIAMLDRTHHPVREYLGGLSWDGVKRLDTLFIDYLGAEDSAYTRAVTRASLIGAAARIMSPGCKHDHTLVLVGPQGCRKSTTLAKLGREWFSDSLYTLSGKDAYEQIQGFWIIEMAEMAAAKKSEIEQIKQFVSKRIDSFRAAYARRVQDHPRQCAFFGSTNDSTFIKDHTGGRRFWPVVVTEAGRELADGLTSEIVDQVWAEALEAYNSGEKWYLTGAVEDEARRVQREHTEKSDKTGMVEAFIEKEVPKDWDKFSLEERRVFWSEAFTPEALAETVPRTKVCAMEVWCELFNGDPKQYSKLTAMEINGILKDLSGWEERSVVRCGDAYGRQRGFVRKTM